MWIGQHRDNLDQLVDYLIKLLDTTDDPLRIVCWLFQDAALNRHTEEIQEYVDKILRKLQDKPRHMLVFATILYRPSDWHYWNKIKAVNNILRKANLNRIEMDNITPINLHKQVLFYNKDVGYCLNGEFWMEFMEGKGPGHTLTPLGYSKIVRAVVRYFQKGFDLEKGRDLQREQNAEIIFPATLSSTPVYKDRRDLWPHQVPLTDSYGKFVPPKMPGNRIRSPSRSSRRDETVSKHKAAPDRKDISDRGSILVEIETNTVRNKIEEKLQARAKAREKEAKAREDSRRKRSRSRSVSPKRKFLKREEELKIKEREVSDREYRVRQDEKILKKKTDALLDDKDKFEQEKKKFEKEKEEMKRKPREKDEAEEIEALYDKIEEMQAEAKRKEKIHKAKTDEMKSALAHKESLILHYQRKYGKGSDKRNGREREHK